MEKHYKLHKIKELAENDNAFITTLAKAFIDEVPADALLLKQAVENKNLPQAYQIAHKIKPTIALFDLEVLHQLIEILNWSKQENENKPITIQLTEVLTAIKNATHEIKTDFKL